MGKMTEEEKKEYERMTRETEQLRLKMDKLLEIVAALDEFIDTESE